jgi:hypothetical protein
MNKSYKDILCERYNLDSITEDGFNYVVNFNVPEVYSERYFSVFCEYDFDCLILKKIIGGYSASISFKESSDIDRMFINI